MARRDAVKLLGSCSLFSGLSRRELNAILRTAKEVTHEEGQKIVSEDTDAVGFHLILEGRATVSTRGRKRAELGPGDYFGEMSLLDGQPRTATVTPTEPMRTLAISSWDFMPMIEKFPSIARKMLVEMSGRLRDAYRDAPEH